MNLGGWVGESPGLSPPNENISILTLRILTQGILDLEKKNSLCPLVSKTIELTG